MAMSFGMRNELQDERADGHYSTAPARAVAIDEARAKPLDPAALSAQNAVCEPQTAAMAAPPPAKAGCREPISRDARRIAQRHRRIPVCH
jgi:hypothetical protein